MNRSEPAVKSMRAALSASPPVLCCHFPVNSRFATCAANIWEDGVSRTRANQRFERVMRFLLSLRDGRVAAYLAQRGFDEAERREGWRLFMSVPRASAKRLLTPSGPGTRSGREPLARWFRSGRCGWRWASHSHGALAAKRTPRPMGLGCRRLKLRVAQGNEGRRPPGLPPFGLPPAQRPMVARCSRQIHSG